MLPPPHARTTHTHTKRRALLGASCAGRLLGPAAAFHHTLCHYVLAHAHAHAAWRFTRCWGPLLSSTTTCPHRTHAHAHEAPRVAWRFVCGLPAGARCCLPPQARTTHTHTHTLLGASHVAGTRCGRPLPHARTTHKHVAHAHEAPRVAWRFVCGPPAWARCCLPPHTPVSCARTHTLLGASHVAGAHCCHPPRHARTTSQRTRRRAACLGPLLPSTTHTGITSTHSHTQHCALLGAECAGGPV